MRRVVTLLSAVILCSGLSSGSGSGGGALAQRMQEITDVELYKILQSGTELLKQNKFEEAAAKFREGLARDPKNLGAEMNLGVALLQMGKYDEAQPVLQKASKDHPEDADVWLNLATSYQSTGKITESLTCLHQFLKLGPHHPQAGRVQSMITALDQDQAQRAKISGSDQGEDYLADAIQGGTVRFARDRFPLKVYIEPGSSVPGFKPEYDAVAHGSFEDWHAAAPDYLSFVYVPTADAADITVIWTNDPSKMVSTAEGGHAMIAPGANGIVKSDITLLTTQPVSHASLNETHLRHIILHEIGHALGICGHSPRPSDIMYGIVMPTDTISALSDRDKHTMVALYAAHDSALHPVNAANIMHQGDANNPITKMMVLNNAGATAMKQGHYAEALEKFEQALKMDPSNFMLKQNVGALYTNFGNMAAMKRDFVGAENYYKKAIPILEQSPDKTNLKLVLKNYSSTLNMAGRAADASKIEAKLAAVK